MENQQQTKPNRQCKERDNGKREIDEKFLFLLFRKKNQRKRTILTTKKKKKQNDHFRIIKITGPQIGIFGKIRRLNDNFILKMQDSNYFYFKNTEKCHY